MTDSDVKESKVDRGSRCSDIFRHRLNLDLRATEDFHAGHIAHSYHIHPLTELKTRYSYLPPRDQAFLVIADVEQRSDVREAFSDHGGARVVFLCPSDQVTPDGIDKADFFRQAEDLGVLRSSDDHRSRLLSVDDVPKLLFQPSKAVERIVTHMESDPKDASSMKRVLDLGCGAARDLVWILHRSRNMRLGMQRRWKGVGLDNWKATVIRARQIMSDLYLSAENPDVAEPACEGLVWARCNASLIPLTGTGKGRAVIASTDISDEPDALRRFAELGLDGRSGARYDLVICVRFYPLDTLLGLSLLVRNNGLVLISHFVSLDECDKAAWTLPNVVVDYDSPPHEGRIQPGQIESLVQHWNTLESDFRWTIHEDLLEPIEDGRLIRSVALRKTCMIV